MRRLTLLLLLLASPLVHADARAQLDAFSGGVKGLSADFRQRVYDPDGRLGEESTGTVQLRAPRQFRWEYLKPFPQLIVADGDHVWVYDPDLEQVNVRNQSAEENNSPLAVLIDPTELERQFKVKEGGLKVVKSFELNDTKTKLVVGAIKALKTGNTLIVDGDNAKLEKSARNLADSRYLHVDGINVMDLLRYESLVITESAVKAVSKRLLGE